MRRSRAVRRLALATAPWPLLRPCLSPRFARLHRRQTALGAAYLVTFVVAVVVLAVWSVWLLVPVAVAAVVSSAYQFRRSRAGYGLSQGLPPGALPLVSVDPRTDRRFFERRIGRYGPVFKAVVPGRLRPVVCVSGLERGAALLRDHEGQLEWLGMGFDPLIPAGFIRSMRPDDHRRYRKILASGLTDRAVESSVPFFAATARAMFREGWNAGTPVDPRPALARFTLTSLARLFLGVVPDTEEHAVIETLYIEPGPLYYMGGVDGSRGLELRKATDEMAGLVRSQIERISDTALQPEPAQSFLSEIVKSHEHAGDDPNIVLNLVFLLANASRDVTGLLHWIVKMLADSPAWTERVRAQDDPGNLCRAIVAETLRLAQSEYIARRATESFELGGYVVPEHWYLRVCVQEAHRDPAVFPNPEAFDPERFLERRYTRGEYAPFGMLTHSCLGANTTARLAETFVRELSHSYDLEVVKDGAVVHDGYHWRPSTRHRVRLVARVPRNASGSTVVRR
jgi:cytochrome P450